jgi:low affinity Fe/Cu permease
MNIVRRGLTKLGVLTAAPAAFALFVLYVIGWAVFDRDKLDWHAFATLSTWFMTLLIQRAEHRDTQAIHAKLDELIRAHDRIGNATTQLDDKEPEDIETYRELSRKRDQAKTD